FSSYGSQAVMGGGLLNLELVWASGPALDWVSDPVLVLAADPDLGLLLVRVESGVHYRPEVVEAPLGRFLKQVLNDRLATYLEKVKRLEATNLELNEKLRAFTINRVQSSFNLEPYEIQIKPLREK
ncbi:hypothetical protein M9458_000291, partial [Cirrhinus mrigala]